MKLRNFTLSGIVLLLSILFIADANAQDPRFSQFYASPLTLNPAMTGVFEGKFRAAINYREQWASILDSHPFRTIAASVDMRSKMSGGDYIAYGINVLHDNQAGTGLFTQSRGYLNVSYLKKMGGNRYTNRDQYLIAGAQLGAGQNAIDGDKYWYTNQFDEASGSPNYEAPTGEAGLDSKLTTDIFIDFNAGLMYYALMDDNMSFYAGAAANHLNSPSISFLGQTDDLYLRWVVHAGGEIPLNPELSALPAVAVMGQGPSLSATGGLNFRYSNHDWREVAIRAGVWAHVVGKYVDEISRGASMDAVVISAILEMDRWNVGVSYDINTSSLKRASNSRGAVELSLIYTHRYKSRYRTNCPKF